VALPWSGERQVPKTPLCVPARWVNCTRRMRHHLHKLHRISLRGRRSVGHERQYAYTPIVSFSALSWVRMRVGPTQGNPQIDPSTPLSFSKTNPCLHPACDLRPFWWFWWPYEPISESSNYENIPRGLGHVEGREKSLTYSPWSKFNKNLVSGEI